MPERYKIIRHGIYTLITLLLFILQTARGVEIKVLGAQPDYLIFFIAAMGMYEGAYVTAIYGFAAGLALSVSSMSAEGLLAIYYGLFGLFCGHFSATYMRKIVFWPAIIGSIGMIVKGLIGYVFYYWLAYGAPFLPYAEGIVFKIVMSVPFSFLFFLITSRMHKHVSEKEQ